MTQKEYLNKQLQYKRKITLSRIFLLLLFLTLWEILSRMSIINSFIFSSPMRIAKGLFAMIKDNSLFYHIGITTAETIVSFIIVTSFSIAFALLLWCIRPLAHILEPYLVTLNSLPKSALAPVLIVWLGTGYKTIIVTAISVCIFGTILSLYSNLLSIDPDKIKLILTFSGKKRDILLKLLIPESIPCIINQMKVNIGLCLVGVIIAEFLVAKAGLGYVIIYNSQIFKMDYVLLSICILCVLAIILYKITELIDKKINRRPNQ